MILFIFVIGLRPGPFVDPINPAVEKIAAGMVDVRSKPLSANVKTPAAKASAKPAAH
ncbi:MAG: hypothetical protein NT172_14700 [Planctomycetota bacterium]|nr:hypothetical protein [Planctomycetota bacterium]